MSSRKRRYGVLSPRALSICAALGVLMLLPAAAQAAPPTCEDVTDATLPTKP